MSDYTEEFNAIMEDNVQYICYSRSYSHNYNSVKEEMSCAVPPGVDLDKAHKWLQNRVHYNLQQSIEMLKRDKFNMQGIRIDYE